MHGMKLIEGEGNTYDSRGRLWRATDLIQSSLWYAYMLHIIYHSLHTKYNMQCLPECSEVRSCV